MQSIPSLKLRHIVENLSLNPGAEIVRYGRRKTGVLSLGQGEGDMATPDFIIKAVEKALANPEALDIYKDLKILDN